HGSDFHRNWAHQTISQNTVLVNGKGQRSVGPFAQGKIDDFKLTPEWDYVLGNAVDAYEGRLKKANRHILFVKPDIIVIYDDLEAPEEADFQFMLHSLSEFELPSSSTAELHIQRPGAGALIQYHGSLPVKFRQWDGFDPQPERRQFPNNWHLETSTATKAKEVQMFTVIAPHRGKDRPELKVERIQSASANGLKLNINGRLTVVGFRKGVTGKAELSGVTFESPVLVQVAQDSATK
ncbi:MAG: heparinase II/III family protein, partial [Limisphaerales bacterium]